MPEVGLSRPVRLPARVVTTTPQTQAPVVVGKPITTTTNNGHRVYVGEGHPPAGLIGVTIGDTYIDTLTGDVYRLTPGL